jgi:hypothetical protein
MSNAITFDQPTYQKLKTEYSKAKSDNIEIFVFQGHELLTDYAKYLLEYLESKMN